MLESKLPPTGEMLIVSRPLWLRLVSAPFCLFFFCCTVAALASPLCPTINGFAPLGWGVALTLAGAAALLTEFPLSDTVEAAPRFEA